MPTTCAVVDCHSRGGRDNKRFFRIPRVIKHQWSETEGKSEKRQRLWLAAINRSDITPAALKHLRVCSDHFISGSPVELYNDTDPDWIPNTRLGYTTDKSSSNSTRYKRLQQRKEQKGVVEAAKSLLDLSSACIRVDTNMEDETDCATENTELTDADRLEIANQEISHLKTENLKLTNQNECLRNDVHKMKCNRPEDFENDDKVRYYTGLPTYITLMALFNLLSPGISENRNSSLSKFQKLILTLMRLRLNMPIVDLSYRFGISKATVSKVFLDMVNLMYVILQPIVRWPEREELYETMPMVFRKYFGRKITVIIDCFEIFIDRPSNMMARAQTWSSYKHHNTAKYLIGITPQGTVSFISEGWGGRVSDKHLTKNCGFLDNLIHGDVILADRGFDIQELVALVGAEVKFPSFTRGKTQLSASDVESTRKIANVRIHVERVIGTVRQKFVILSSTCPIDYVITKHSDSCPMLDKIVFVCCALTNMCPSVVPFN